MASNAPATALNPKKWKISVNSPTLRKSGPEAFAQVFSQVAHEQNHFAQLDILEKQRVTPGENQFTANSFVINAIGNINSYYCEYVVQPIEAQSHMLMTRVEKAVMQQLQRGRKR